MIRKSISCALAGLLIVVPALALFGLFGHWQPGSGVVVLSLVFCFMLSGCSPSTHVAIRSGPVAVDGDTIVDHGVHIRLTGL
jgi:hypothetical protein